MATLLYSSAHKVLVDLQINQGKQLWDFEHHVYDEIEQAQTRWSVEVNFDNSSTEIPDEVFSEFEKHLASYVGEDIFQDLAQQLRDKKWMIEQSSQSVEGAGHENSVLG